MLTTVQAVLQPNGSLQFLEPIHIDKPQHVLVTLSSQTEEATNGLALSEATLAIDWLRDEEDEAWAHLQPNK